MHPILARYNQVNAFGKLLGMELNIIVPGEVEYAMAITEKHLSNPAAAHGGALAALMDAILGVSALSLAAEDGKLVSTVEFKINYFAPIRLGDKLLGHGKVVFKGNRLLSSEGTIYNLTNERKVVCKGLGTFNTYPVEKNRMILTNS